MRHLCGIDLFCCASEVQLVSKVGTGMMYVADWYINKIIRKY
jgi:hypothetical protein